MVNWVDFMKLLKRAFRIYPYEFNATTGQWEKKTKAGTSSITVSATIASATPATLATITANFKGIVTYLYIDVEGTTDDFVMRENATTTVFTVLAGGNRTVDQAAPQDGAILELAAGVVDIATGATDQGTITMTYHEERITPS